MTIQELLALSDEEIMRITHQLCIPYQLKRTIRYSGSRDLTVHGESVGEHIFGLFYLDAFFRSYEDEHGLLDNVKVCNLIRFHEFGEIVTGDHPYHRKTEAHEAEERIAARHIFTKLPSTIAELGLRSWEEFDQRQSREARYVYALDKIEPMFELLDPVSEVSMKRTHFTHRDHIEKKSRATEGFPVMTRFLEAVTNDMLARDVFWPSE